jgi:hypothetical protein
MTAKMKRRDFITLLGGAAATWPLAAGAQQPGGMRQVAVFVAYAEDDPETKSRLAAFRAGLARRGWSEGRNVRIDYRLPGRCGTDQTIAYPRGHGLVQRRDWQRDHRPVDDWRMELSNPIN